MGLREELVLAILIIGALIVAGLVFGPLALTILDQWWFFIVLIGIVVVIYFVLDIRPRRPKIPFQEGEFFIKQFTGSKGRPDVTSPVSFGRWYLTNRRLIYEGKTEHFDLKRAVVLGPGWTRGESDVLSYPLDKLKNIEIIGKGRWRRKYIKATFKGENGEHHVHIFIMRNEEFFIETIQGVLGQSKILQ